MRAKIERFVTTDIWRVRSQDLPKKKSYWFRPMRVLVLALRNFQEDKCPMRASALTFYSLMSLVPVVAMAFGISKGFGLEKALEKQLFEKFQGQEEIIAKVTTFANTMLETTRGGLIAGVGVLLLLWTIIRVLGHIEKSFNHIWGIKKERSFPRKVSDYLSAMIICPLLFIVSSAATVAIKTQVTFVVQKVALLGPLGPVIFTVMRVLPYAVIWVLFTFVYMFMPNTKVKFKAALFAGILAGTLFHLFQWVYLWSQIGVSKYNAIYGSFAALPLFLVWLQTSWIIVLLGAEISFASQNEQIFEFDRDVAEISYALKKLVALRVTHLLIKDFMHGSRPVSCENLSRRLEVPIRLARDILNELVESGLVSEVRGPQNGEVSYQPARDTDTYTIKSVLEKLEQRGSTDLPVARSKELEKIADCLKGFSNTLDHSPDNILLKEI